MMWPSTPHIRKDIQSKLLVVHSKGGRYNFRDLLHCDDRESPLLASRDEPRHDRSRSDTFMINMNLTVMPVWLYFSSFLFVSVIYYYYFFNVLIFFIYYTGVNCV